MRWPIAEPTVCITATSFHLDVDAVDALGANEVMMARSWSPTLFRKAFHIKGNDDLINAVAGDGDGPAIPHRLQGPSGSVGTGEKLWYGTAQTRRQADVDDPQSFVHRFVSVNGIRMHYVEEGEGPLVLLLHGYPFLWYLWRHQIKVLAAAGYRVVAPDQRGYGQTDCPPDVGSYDMTHLVGDVVGLMKAVDSKSAVLIGHDFGSPVAYNTALMRPDLVRGVLMMCAPPAARGPIRPSDAWKQIYKGLNFYQSHWATPEANAEILRDLRRFLLGVFYSTSGYCPADKQWRWAWKTPETFSDTYTVPETLPPFLTQQALDHYLGEFTRTGIRPANNWYAATDKSWDNTSFLDGAIVKQPALFLTGENDPSTKPVFGIDRQGPALKALKTTLADMREIILIPSVGHTPPKKDLKQSTPLFLNFLRRSASNLPSRATAHQQAEDKRGNRPDEASAEPDHILVICAQVMPRKELTEQSAA